MSEEESLDELRERLKAVKEKQKDLLNKGDDWEGEVPTGFLSGSSEGVDEWVEESKKELEDDE